MTIVESIVLAIVEGLTEFLPVSSTGHMIIASSLMGIASDPFTKMFTIVIQLGAILSVAILYFRKFLPTDQHIRTTFQFYLKLVVAFIPAAIFGVLLNDYIDALLESVVTVAIFLILGGIVFLFIDKIFKDSETKGSTEVSFGAAFKIGLFQTIAIAGPGVSRSAATIIGGLTQKLTRRAAAEFSFFLAVPTMFGATALKMFKYFKAGSAFGSHEVMLLIIGNVVAFAVAIVAIRSFVNFLTRHGFKMFGYYRIVVGAIILILTLFGVDLSIV